MANVAMVVSNACAPDPRVERSAAWLTKVGHQVTIYAFDRQLTDSPESKRNGYEIKRFQSTRVPYGGLLRTALGLRRFKRHVFYELKAILPDIVICHDADTLDVGIWMKKRFSTTLIFDMHDLHHTWVRIPNPNSLFRKLISNRLQQRLVSSLSGVDKIITSSGKIDGGQSSGFREWLLDRGFESVVIENRPMHVHTPKGIRDGYQIAHIGRLRDLESIDLLIQAICSMETSSRPSLLIAGDGVSSDIIQRKVENSTEDFGLVVEVLGKFDQEMISDMLKHSTAMFAMYSPLRGNIMDGAIPVKMFDAAARGIPSIVNSGCLMSEICEYEGLGITVKWGDVAALREAIIASKDMHVILEKTGKQEEEKYLLALSEFF